VNVDLVARLTRTMLFVRRVEEEIASRYHEQQMRCPTHLSIGQEAVPAVLSEIALPTDYAVSTHRGHAHYLGKGGNLPSMIAEIYGKATGCSSGKGGSMHLIDLSVGFMGTSAIVGNSIPIGVGLAMASKVLGQGRVSFVFFGEGATEEGVFFESINFAAVRRLPVVFVCENNLYSVYSPLSVRQPDGRRLTAVTSAMGVESVSVEDSDVEEVHRVMSSAVERARGDGGPQFVEVFTYRYLEHCGPNCDDDLGYRSPDEVARWRGRDPLTRSIAELEGSLSGGRDWLDEQEASIRREITSAFEFAIASPFPEPIEAFRGEYSERN
jgi:TPP-dependent pyruvate/acetoin dehydrogenase alpha subunit